MRYNIKINEVRSDDSQVKAFATLTFGDSLVVRNIAIVQKRDSEDVFVSMPSHRTNDVNKKGEPIYRDICNPITKEFYEELVANILEAYEKRKEISADGLNYGAGESAPAFTVKVTPIAKDDSSLRAIGRIYLEDSFVINNVKLLDGKNGLFVSMPDYRTDKYRDGKPIYREIVFPITKEYREALYGEFEKTYSAEKEKKVSENTQKKAASKEKSKDKEKDEPAAVR